MSELLRLLPVQIRCASLHVLTGVAPDAILVALDATTRVGRKAGQTALENLRKGLEILEFLAAAAEGRTAGEVAEHLGIHRTSAYRYVNALQATGYVQAEGNGQYVLGTRILELASKRLGSLPLRETARPYLVALCEEMQMTVHLCVLDRHEIVYIDKVESQRTLPLVSRIGGRAPAYCTGVGKAILSCLPEEQVRTMFRHVALEPRTPNTIADLSALLRDLEVTAQRGYAVDRGELEQGVACCAAAVRGHGGDVVGSISVTTLARELEVAQVMERAVMAIKRTANEIALELGFSTSDASAIKPRGTRR